jgi:hypothetical protein
MRKLLALALLFFFKIESSEAFSLIPEGTDTLAEAFKTGQFRADDFITYGLWLIGALLRLVGMAAVIVIMLGGYYYVIGSFSEEKEKGKNTIKYGIFGFALAILSWIIVDFIVTFLTTE